MLVNNKKKFEKREVENKRWLIRRSNKQLLLACRFLGPPPAVTVHGDTVNSKNTVNQCP